MSALWSPHRLSNIPKHQASVHTVTAYHRFRLAGPKQVIGPTSTKSIFQVKTWTSYSELHCEVCRRPRPLRGYCVGCDSNDFERFHRAYIVSRHRVDRTPEPNS